MKFYKIIPLVLASAMLLSGCNLPFGNKKTEAKETTYELTATPKEELKNGMFYVKTDDAFYPVAAGQSNLNEKNRIAKESDPTRILSFTKDDVMIPTLYKDDKLVYSTTSGISGITLERFKDLGWSVGFYNLQDDESNKVKYVIGKSSYDRSSSLKESLSTLSISDESALIIVDRIGGKQITIDDLSECGTINGLKTGSIANIDLYIGTKHYELPATVDTHILSSMELYELNEYALNPEGYAEIAIPDYLLSGYYYINGIGVFRYVANEKADGVAGVDFSVPYFYEDQNGKKITKEEYDKLKGNITDNEKEKPSNTFEISIDATQKSYSLDISYELTGKENKDSLSYREPYAEIVSPDGQSTKFDTSTRDKKEHLSISINGMKSGTWTVNLYNLENYALSYVQSIESGNADSFVHSGNGEGKITIHTDGISGPANAIINWEKSEHAVEESKITSPSGTEYKYVRSSDDGTFASTYGNLTLPLSSVEPGEWTMTIRGEELGRVWFKFESVTDTQPIESAAGEQASMESTDEDPMDVQENKTIPQDDTDEVPINE